MLKPDVIAMENNKNSALNSYHTNLNVRFTRNTKLSNQTNFVISSDDSTDLSQNQLFHLEDRIIISSNKEKTIHEFEDLAYSFQYVFLIGRAIGMIPVMGFLNGCSEALEFRKRSFASFSNIIVIIGLCISVLMGLVRFLTYHRETVNQLADSIGPTVFYGGSLFVYCYFQMYSKEFIQLLKKWKSTHIYYSCEDKTLRRDGHLIAGILLVSIMLENITWHMKELTPHKLNGTICCPVIRYSLIDPNSGEPLEFGTLKTFYYISMREWTSLFPHYHPAIASFAIILNKFALYGWNYFDILIIITSRAVYGKYKLLHQLVGKALEEQNEDSISWKKLISDHLTITSMLTTIEEFFSPIIIVSYTANIFDLCTHITSGLSPTANSTFVGSIYSLWSFCHLGMRLFLVTISAARINEYALGICKLLKKCPIKKYTKDIKKFETQLFHSTIGLGAYGSFTITKSFMLQILSVVFTIEIVLLQSGNTNAIK